MVRINQKTDFTFPFGNDEETVISTNNLDKTDRLLSSFALSFFLGVLFLILMDGDNVTFQNNEITSSWNQQSMMVSLPLFTTDKSKDEEIPYVKPLAKNLVSSISKVSIETKKKVVAKPIISKPTVVRNKKVELTKPSIIREAKEKVFTKKVLPSAKEKSVKLNTSPTTKLVKEKINVKPTEEKVLKNINSTLLEKEELAQTLVINETITQDLLPISYFEAKDKAKQEGKLLFIKFGAKWCLPCRQMNQTTFNDQRVKEILQENYVGLNIDVQDFDGVNLQSYFNVESLPTILVFNNKGKFLAKYSKFISASKMIEVLESHAPEKNEIEIPLEIISIPLANRMPTPEIPSVVFNQIQLKKSLKGDAITQFKGKAKNWRYTSINMDIKNIDKGNIEIKIVEKKSGKRISNLDIPWAIEQNRITGTTTTNFQLDLPLAKRKKKEGEYVLEIFHVNQNSSKLIGETTLANNGIIF